MEKRIKELRLKRGMTLKQVADSIGVSEATAQRYESGAINNLKYETAVALANLFHVSPQYLLGWDDSPISPIYEAAAGPGRLNDGYPTEEISIRLEADETIVRVNGRSMEPTLRDGDRVIVSATSIVDDSSQIALVQVDGEEYTLKHVQLDDDGLTLVADNVSVYTPRRFTARQVEELPVRILGVVKVLIRDFQ